MKFKNYIETESGIKDTSASPGTAGQLLSSTVAGTSWIDQNTISSGSSEVVDIQVKNISSANGGVNLVKGDPVYIYGSVGASARLYVDLADADSTATNNLGDSKMPCVALLDQDLAPNIKGTATVVGKLRNLITSPIDGNVPNENDTVYVKPGGGLTLTKPTGSTNLIQNVGQVGRVSASSDGNIVVAALLRTNDVPNLPEGRLFVGTSANTSLVSDVVYVDDTNDRVGIGTAFPESQLHLEKNTSNAMLTLKSTGGGDNNSFIRFFEENNGATYSVGLNRSDAQFRIAYSTDGNSLAINPRFVIDNTGDVGIGTTNPTAKTHIEQTIANGTIAYPLKVDVMPPGSNASGDGTGISFGIGNNVNNRKEQARITVKQNYYGVRPSMSFDTTDYNSPYTDFISRILIDPQGNVGIGTSTPSYKLQLSSNSAAKPSSSLWTVVSDSRVKENIRDYTTGLEAIIKIEPKIYDYNGKAGFEKTKDNIGIIAQDMQNVMPETIKTYNTKLNEDDTEDTELLNFDGHAVTFALINAVKDLKAEIEELKKQINK